MARKLVVGWMFFSEMLHQGLEELKLCITNAAGVTGFQLNLLDQLYLLTATVVLPPLR